MVQKCIKLKIIKPYNGIEWHEFGTVLHGLRDSAFKSANFVMRECYLNAIAKTNGESVSKDYYYPKLTKMFPEVAAHIIGAMDKVAVKKWRQCKKDVLSSRVSLPTFKQGLPAYLHHKGYEIQFIDGSYIIDAQLCSRNCEHTRYSFIIAANDHSTRTILAKILSGEYQKGEGQILKDRKGDWYFVMPYKFEAQHHNIDKNNIMGIDLGITKAAYWAFSGSHKRGSIPGDEIEEFRRRVRKRRIAIQKQGKYCGDGRIGHGTARRLLPVDILSEKEANFRDTCNHRYAKYIVDEALHMACGVIQIEDLTGIADYTKKKFLKNWSYFDLQTKITNKAAEYGIEVQKVNPQYTSQRCSECGLINKESRLDQATFICTECKYGSLYHCFSCNNNQEIKGKCVKCGEDTKLLSINADYNAARNLAIENIEDIILETVKKQGLKIMIKKNAKGKRP